MTRHGDDDRFEIHGFWRTSATYRVRVAFHLKGVRPRETVVDMDGGEQNGEAYRRRYDCFDSGHHSCGDGHGPTLEGGGEGEDGEAAEPNDRPDRWQRHRMPQGVGHLETAGGDAYGAEARPGDGRECDTRSCRMPSCGCRTDQGADGQHREQQPLCGLCQRLCRSGLGADGE